MNERMSSYFRMGTVHFMSYPNVLQDESQILPTLKKILSDPFFSAVEMAPIADPAIRAEAKQMLAHSDVSLVYTVAPKALGGKMNLNSTDEAARLADVQRVKCYIDEAIDMGAEGIGIIAGHYDPAKVEEAFQALVDSCKALCSYAAKKPGFRVELEQFDYDFHNKVLMGPTSLVRRLAQAMEDFDNFGILIDLSHLPLVRETPEECLSQLKGYVTHAHIGNAVCNDPGAYLYGDFHPRFSLPNSAVDVSMVADFLRSLKNIGFFQQNRPLVSFEIKAWDGDDPDIVLAECKRMMERAWALV